MAADSARWTTPCIGQRWPSRPRRRSPSRIRLKWSGSRSRFRRNALPSAGSFRRILTSTWRGFDPTSIWGSGTSCFTLRDSIRRGSSISTPIRSYPGCARHLAEPTPQRRCSSAAELRLIALPDIPQVDSGDDLAAFTEAALARGGLALRSDDVLVFAQKVVSKAEGRRIDLADVVPSARALELAQTVQKDPRLVELVLRESRRIVRFAKDVLIVEHRLGLIMANAGIDQSNVADPAGGDFALLLPEDPDLSAARLRERLHTLTGCEAGIIISDSFGRPWRVGTVGVAIGCAGFAATLDLRGRTDLFGRSLRVTVVGHADEVASAASVLMGQGSEGRPVILARGLATRAPQKPATALMRPHHQDLFQ